ncbi:MAG: glycoside hydrolase family 5 protein [Myxococcota bacterium]|nr:glycoside hydrolase family 5 protein [Myxococcota bacterium]
MPDSILRAAAFAVGSSIVVLGCANSDSAPDGGSVPIDTQGSDGAVVADGSRGVFDGTSPTDATGSENRGSSSGGSGGGSGGGSTTDSASGMDASSGDASGFDGSGNSDTGIGDSGKESATSDGAMIGPQLLSVVGNQLMTGGKPVRLIGMNYPGPEYMCLGGSTNGIFQGPSDQTLITAIKGQQGHAAWNVNAIRVPLNEDCWLGINGVPAVQSGTAYQNAVITFVKMLRQSGFFVILDLHWNAPAGYLADAQQPMADADHSPAFWRSVASIVNANTNRDTGILFDLYNEPSIYPPSATLTGTYPNDQNWWSCWQNGGCQVTMSNGVAGGMPSPSSPLYPNPLPPKSPSWQVAGMQSLVDAVRSTGATNVLMLGGLGVANILDHWLEHKPTDTLSPPQIAASFHQYDVDTGTDVNYWNATVAPVAQMVPVITGELGETTGGHAFTDGYMAWADQHGVSYLAWAFNPYGSPALITGFNGAPTAFGAGYQSHIATLPVVPAPLPM